MIALADAMLFRIGMLVLGMARSLVNFTKR